ncbi:MAG: hypothetical protein Q8Q31_01615 [Nanoarchaeota archaeon]|nr:hypothetical protein [Nanoarchaeota archaeon]
MTLCQELRQCLVARTLAEIAFDLSCEAGRKERELSQKGDFIGAAQVREKYGERKESGEERKRVLKVTHYFLERMLGEKYLERYLGGDNRLLFDAKELSRIRRLCKAIDMHTQDPFIQVLLRGCPSFSYRNGSGKLYTPLPSSTTVKVGWYCLGGNEAPTLRVFALKELSFIGELPKIGTLYEVYYNLQGQVFTKNRRGGSPLAHSWDMEKALRFHIKRVKDIYGGREKAQLYFSSVR